MKKPMILAVPALALSLLLSACGSPATSTLEEPAVSASSSSSAVAESPAPSVTPEDSPSPSEPAPPATAGTALELLGKLEVKPANTTADYDRDLFGEPWEDIDGNGCDTRNDMLLRDLEKITVAADECTVLLGVVIDPYSGNTVNFDRSKGGGGGLDIDHVVALSAAFRTGGSDWSPDKKLQFANDPLNLITSASGPNRAKGDKDASEWLPEDAGNPAFNCRYVARQVAVKAKYGSWITPSEEGAMRNVLTGCPQEPVPTDSSVLVDQDTPVSNGGTVTAPQPVQEAPAPAPATGGGVDPDYGSCAKAKAAGAGPYTTADPEYKFYRDGDNDGTVCE